MFTGLIEGLGHIEQVQAQGGDVRLRVAAGSLPMSDVALGDSIAVNGVCLTVVEFNAQSFCADVSLETLKVTCAKNWRTGTRVNLERALLPTTRLGGHLVSGHVDGIAEVISRTTAARAEQFVLRAPKALSRYIAMKGSVCVDGISLTVNGVEGECVHLTIVPHTLSQTTIGDWRAGTQVNLEVDLLARYVERLLLKDTGNHEQRDLSSLLTQSFTTGAGA